MSGPSTSRAFAALSSALPAAAAGNGDSAGDDVAVGYLVVRASGASAARMAIDAPTVAAREPAQIQLVMRASLPKYVPARGVSLSFPECALRARPAGRSGTVMLTVSTAKLSISFAELRPLMFRPVPLDRSLQTLFAAAVSHLLVVSGSLDPHGIKPYLTGLAELVLRSALRTELSRADAIATRRRDAVAHIKEHLSDPALTAERIAEALFISRRRLYQLFDDGDGVSGRIRQLRIDRAKELLGDPAHANRGIGEISKQCGFANAAHFSRTFRKVVGETPRDYRDKLLTDSAKSTDDTS
ncbi:helix-turn-helix transcriptional regulator [Actinophytocola algeriensis]|uniref:AraC-like DNA-binding protein n=1 Tax=Actinophytocola algeriensis TaxID=1768010 RepID=A0A7W7Q3K8_9PSEU|nr:helix-turn-helix transcriptional regulator [Actinophytocola algeriensis]MBB4906309.1 AraC-like DNA-binding protein [Actinophytocola algeriensis]MBE1477790.1 AraC-like DNA-binding protein [Actinophytocola algeriensis]